MSQSDSLNDRLTFHQSDVEETFHLEPPVLTRQHCEIIGLPSALHVYTKEGCHCQVACNHQPQESVLQVLYDVSSQLDLGRVDTRRILLQSTFDLTREQALELLINYIDCGRNLKMAIESYDPSIIESIFYL